VLVACMTCQWLMHGTQEALADSIARCSDRESFARALQHAPAGGTALNLAPPYLAASSPASAFDRLIGDPQPQIAVMQLALASGRCGLPAPRRPAASRRPSARGPMVRSVLEINKPASTANGAGKLDLADEMTQLLKYRLAAPNADTDKLYQSGEAFVGGQRPSLPQLQHPPCRRRRSRAHCPARSLPRSQWPGACTTAWWMPLTRPRSTGSEPMQWEGEAGLPGACWSADATWGVPVAVLMQRAMHAYTHACRRQFKMPAGCLQLGFGSGPWCRRRTQLYRQ